MSRPILNLDEVELKSLREVLPGAPEGFGGRAGTISMRVGARKLGYNLTVLAPGEKAFPRHNHHVNEEMFLVLDGTGSVRIGDATHALRAGDVIACPPGGPEGAHQIVNTGERELRYLSVSTMQYPEVVDYPDSGKTGVRYEVADKDGKPAFTRFLVRSGESLAYWDGE
jgi:uncharacterized cupin superfamily protein